MSTLLSLIVVVYFTHLLLVLVRFSVYGIKEASDARQNYDNKRIKEILTKTREECKKCTRHPDLMIKKCFFGKYKFFFYVLAVHVHTRVFSYMDATFLRYRLDQRLVQQQRNSLQNANTTFKRCNDRKFEESIMVSQFAAIYFQTKKTDIW